MLTDYVIDFLLEVNSIVGSFPLSIIIVVVLSKLILVIPNWKAHKETVDNKDTMTSITDRIQELQVKIKGTESKADIEKYHLELAELSKQHFSKMKLKFINIAIQIPVIYIVWSALTKSDILQNVNLLWFNLGETDILFALAAGVVSFILFKVLGKVGTEQIDSSPQIKFVPYISAVSTIAVGLFISSLFPFYILITNSFTVIQTVIFNILTK